MTELRHRAGPRGAVKRRRMIVIAGAVTAVVMTVAVVAIIAAIPVLAPNAAPTALATRTPTPTPAVTPSSTPAPVPIPTPTFDAGAQSIDDPNSYWVIADKLRPLNPADWEPPDLVEVPVAYANQPFLRQVASDAAVAMFAAFASESGGLQMQSQSAYRSYSTQESVYAGWVSSLGQAGADLTSARPGYSEHQTGLSIDVSASPANCTLEQCFANTPQGQWLASEAWRFGFVLRYPNGKSDVTGYEFEPWHMRYVGAELATELHTTGVQTLEEFFGLPAAPDYAG
ncbi:D-alanyl-D-alanine carboxypeptidase [Salinibacterium xinjiangense]|uniref:D-alanyl-D-alanine carboxypeptidase n=1 Tax=Salinibacterium xinjiangense TaxID=386302 RepID=A0A2C9A1L6_9MICO|nr:M15 family metallopeptidase [Salinibacterium xinjiangense]SOE72838.1 D-alanyl-D-alanine carboxypeptidase [Salinibacterium xinjiangense]